MYQEDEAELGLLGPFRGLSITSSVQTPRTPPPAWQQTPPLLSLRREIPMDISQDCSKCGFPVDEAAQVLEVVEQVAADILPLAQVVLGDQLLHPGCRGGRGAAQRSRRRRTSCDEVEERSGKYRRMMSHVVDAHLSN